MFNINILSGTGNKEDYNVYHNGDKIYVTIDLVTLLAWGGYQPRGGNFSTKLQVVLIEK